MEQDETRTPFLREHLGAIVCFIFVAVLVYLGFTGKIILGPNNSSPDSPLRFLVNETVSASAPVVIRLPEGMPEIDPKVAGSHIKFDPETRGTWSAGSKNSELVFRPASALAIGRHYSVDVSTGTSSPFVSAEFLVAEDPVVLAVFPKKDSEADESSAITIVFNRPMVALSSLDEITASKIPVEISPATNGNWKWISTRNLQFIPEDHLVRSSNYKVAIKKGFTSVEGLPVATFENNFITRPLRLTYANKGEIRYDEPLRFVFNQPIDLNRTMGAITLRKWQGDSASPVDIVAEATSSTLLIWPAHDSNGRAKFWDVNSRYEITVSKAYPAEGDINLDLSLNTKIKTSDIIESFQSHSSSTPISKLDLFDPAGTVEVTFFEEIDLSRSNINAKSLDDIEYGQKCEEADGDYRGYYTQDCVKVPDKKRLVLNFKANAFGRGESVPVTFEKITNTEGLVINTAAIIKTLRTYPEFHITKVIPDNSSGASLTDLTICASTPIVPPAQGDWRTAIVTGGYVAFNYWSEAIPAEDTYQQKICSPDEYLSSIRYGLIPETPYKISLNLTDVFGQSAKKDISFTTTKAAEFYTRLGSLQSIYEVTLPERTRLTYYAENLEYVDVNICQVSPERMLGFLSDRPDPSTPGSALGCVTSRDAHIELPKRYWVNNYFQFDLKKYVSSPLGQYVISLSNPQYRGDSRSPQIYERTYLSVTRLAVGDKHIKWDAATDSYCKEYDNLYCRGISREPGLIGAELKNGGENLYWVSRVGTLVPVSAATVTTYSGRGEGPISLVGTAITDISGVARSAAVPDYVGAVIRSGLDSAIISNWTDTIGYAAPARNISQTYLYSDRPIYRPGQNVHGRGIDRINYDGVQKIATDRTVKVVVSDSRDHKIVERDLIISDYGTFNWDFVLPEGAPLGTYRIEALGGYGFFDVEEYTPAAFQLEAKSDKPEYISGDTAKLDLQATYYFGVPLDGGSVEYTITSQDYYFDRYQDEYFSFGRGWYYCFDCGYGDRYVKRGQARLDQDGHGQIIEKLDLAELFKKDTSVESKILVLAMTVRDSTGREVTTQKSFIVHRGEFYLGVKTDPYFVGKEQDFTVRAKSVDTKGEPIPVHNATLVVNKIVWKTFKRREVDGNFYYRSEETREVVKKESVSTDRDGDWSDKFSLGQEGEYELVLSGADSRGNKIMGDTRLYVYGEGNVEIRETNNDTLELETEKSSVSVGDSPTVIIKSPFGHAKALITVERGKVYHYDIIDIPGNIYAYRVPIVSDYVPNVYVSVLLISGEPEMKFGQIEFQVDRKEHALSVNVTTNKKAYLPGETVEMNIEARDGSGEGVEADLSVAVADLSVLALKGNPKKDPLVFFYNGFPLTVVTATNIKNILHEADIPTGTKGGSGGGGEDLARRKRGEFLDTAFWKASVITDKNGKAHLSFKLPDNLTTWQVETLGVTKDTLLGVDYLEFKSGKDLSLVAIKPRFVVPGDEFMIGAKIFNQTGSRQVLDVSVKSPSLTLSGSTKERVGIAPGETETVYFPAIAPKNKREGVHNFTIKVLGGEYVDEVDQTISITKNETPEYFATAGSSKDAASEYVYIPDGLEAGDGELSVHAQASLARYMSAALGTLLQFPYGCSEQIGSQLSSIAIIKKAISLPNLDKSLLAKKFRFDDKEYTLDQVVNLGLERILENQTPQGGFVYFPGMKPSFYLTLRMIETLADLREAGYKVDQAVLDRAAAYITDEFNRETYYKDNKDSIVAVAYALSRTGRGESIINKALGFSSDRGYLSENSSSLALSELALLARSRTTGFTQERILSALDNRLDIDTRGTYLKSGRNYLYSYYETPIADTALFLRVISAYQKEHPLTDKVIRWLLSSKSPDGSWGTTSNTLGVIRAMSEYLSWQHETEADYILHILFDAKEKGNFDVNSKTVFSEFSKEIAIKDIKPAVLHKLDFVKENRNSLATNFYYDILLRYFLPTENIAPRDEGFTITRGYYRHDDAKLENKLSEVKQGDVIKGHISITVPKERNNVAIESIIPAGFEIVNSNLDTERRPEEQGAQEESGKNYYDNGKLYPDYQELRDDRVFLFTENLAPGVYTYDYYVRALVPGKYQELPAVAREFYAPENFGRTAGSIFTIKKD